MSIAWLYSVASVLLVSLVSLIGIATLLFSEKRLNQVLFVLVALAAGALFGDAFIHLLPESYEIAPEPLHTSLLALAGIFGFLILEKFFRWRHEHTVMFDTHVHPVGYLNLVADAAHNLIDGMLIGASYLASAQLGFATTVAVVLHEIPQEIGDFGVLLHSGFSKQRALLFNFFSASLAIVGAVISLLAGAGSEGFTRWMLPLTAGGFIYIAGSDLLPELHKELKPWRSALQLVAMGTGVGLMVLLHVLE